MPQRRSSHHTKSRRPPGTKGLPHPRDLVSSALAFAAGAVPIAVLGLENGGYEVGVVAAFAIVSWFSALVAVGFRLMPAPRPTRIGWVAAAALAVLTGWGALSLGWSSSPERGLTEVVRSIAFGGALVLGVVAVSAGQARYLLGGVLAGLTGIVGVAVLARLQPELIPAAWRNLETDRLSWPLNYWNALGAVAAMAIALGVTSAARARRSWTSGLAVAFLPVVATGLVLTLSRGGILAAIVGLALAVATVRPRLVVLRTMLAPAVGSAALIAIVYSRPEIPDATGGSVGQDAGGIVVLVALMIAGGVALVQSTLHRLDERNALPRVPRPGPRLGAAIAGTALVLVVVAFFAADGPRRVDDGWASFRDTPLAENVSTSSRLTSLGGNERYQGWSAAIDALENAPVKGQGLGSWQNWWSPRRGDGLFVRNAHSEPFEIAAETGVVGLAALLVLLLSPLAAAVVVRRSDRRERRARAVVPLWGAFLVAISIDWSWQVSAVPVAAALAAGPLLGKPSRRQRSSRSEAEPATSGTSSTREGGAAAGRTRRRAVAVAWPVGLAALTAVALFTCSKALIVPQAIDRSDDAARAGQLDLAAREARAGADAAPFSLTPVLQEAALLERAGRLGDAARVAREAIDREPQNWRPWYVLSRIDGRRRSYVSGLAAYRRARTLNPSLP